MNLLIIKCLYIYIYIIIILDGNLESIRTYE